LPAKDTQAWGIPKGIVNAGEDLLAAARREFEEELGWVGPAEVDYVALGSVRMKSGKTVHAWAFASTLTGVLPLAGKSVFTLEWPPKSGRQQTFPEIDRAEFFTMPQAAEKILTAQLPFLGRLSAALRLS
jgi:predicted NUDIX family NTP pyrophosphohydrolase